MEAIAPHAALGVFVRKCEQLGDLGLGSVKGRIEARDLRQVRPVSADEADRLQIVRLVERRERNVLIEPREYGIVDQRGTAEIHAAMHDPMTNGGKPAAVQMLARPFQDIEHALFMIDGIGRGPGPLPSFFPAHPWPRISAPYRALRACLAQRRQRAVRPGLEELELQGRRSSIENGVGCTGSALDREGFAGGVGHQRCNGARSQAGRYGIGAAGENDRHFCAKHDPRRIRTRQEGQAFRQHVAGFEIGHDQDVCATATGETIFLIFAAPRSMALSSARGPSRIPR